MKEDESMKTHKSSNDYMELQSEASSKGTLLLMIGIIFIATNLRSPLTSIGPLMEILRTQLGISNTIIGILPAIPLLAFGVFSNLSPILAIRIGMERLLFFSLILLTLGIGIRSMAGENLLFTGTILIGLAISICNVLLPSLIKRDFPQKVGLMTGIFSVSMNLCGAIASGISIPLASGLNLGWSGALEIWGTLSFLSILLWYPQVRKKPVQKTDVKSEMKKEAKLWASSTAWCVTFYMGLQSLLFYVIVAWVPQILTNQGMSASSAGWMISIMQFAILPVTFIVPILAGKAENQRLFVLITSLLYLIGVAGLIYGGNSLALISMILLGIAVGSSFSLSMMFFSLRTRTSQTSAELSGMAQSIGYLLASIGPTLFGLLHVFSKGWTIPLVLLMACAILLFLAGLRAGGNYSVEFESSKKDDNQKSLAS
jgi:MFS transporter, CP family, cyanate transporter